jgi:hypothetical protein
MAMRLLVAGVALSSVPACGGPPPAPPAKPAQPSWQDALEGSEALVALIRPKALLRDSVFGPLVKSGLAVALAREGNTPSLDVLTATEELVIALPKKNGAGTMVVLSGVDADRAPERVGDERGMALYKHGADARGVAEWTSTMGKDASLFVLQQRTWVIASGAARQRARIAFANPAGRPAPTYGDAQALAVVRLDAPALLQGMHFRGSLAGVTRNLAYVTVSLLPGKKGVDVVVEYSNDDQAGFAALALEDVKKRLASDPSRRYAWLASSTIAREGNREVRVHVDLPADFLDQVQRASPQDLITL